MVITTHFIDQDWQLHRRIISLNTISDHKGETIGKQLEKCLLDWGIERVFIVIVDNASANKVAISYLRNKLKTWRDGALVLNGDFIYVPCCTHIMNLIVNEGLKKLDNNIISIRNAVKYVRSSTARLKAFQIRVEQEKLLGKNGQASRGSVVLDCPTMWNSTYTMLTTTLKFRSAFDRMANEDKLSNAYSREEEGGNKKVEPPGSYDWDNARQMVRFLKIFYDATLSFSSSLRVTSSTCYNEICKVEKTLNTTADSLDPHISIIASNMKEKFEEYWEAPSKINKIVAAILDPQGKMNFATLCFETLYGKDSAKCAEMKNVVKDVLNKLFEG
ncbi:zinc finger BED domain-containing protein RICESLEEPER 2-like [Citrus sinensis]|uniref:zinc finger BED domain-containing protein RICESLEEPER 2-like n=1 Tax=Citrus clementina TaxID=85681 RepID=UPI000CECF7FD|nr:zinc finger BED domain-containing protein RICESLEEPER 2-like [Citrus x clementina]XP_052287305.1 zinc finger BED domain-containing protein RICESLEEPER 2-like [Citrus sinensis]